ncbi:hypothetical protein BJ878DRAFT_234454 [Calycina marina]|uniref:Oxidase ustYa n=1 Tax=Calycina marina TaxID=1763456 RepID=A0A9P7YWW8_9HELO|nr:hypothetical protein BJ878DRAFT_234454 [Calycina marina]
MWFRPVPTSNRVFIYNKTFPSIPSTESDGAWSALIPDNGGFFEHPSIPASRATLAVLHQLHCLDVIRHGYWAAHEAAMSPNKLDEDDLPAHIRPNHIRHCIDLIRHTLMCHGDTSIETVNKELGGVSGFGTVHQCTDWNALREWVSQQ